MDKQDLRVKKTQKALSGALITLLETTAFNKITVNDICAEAMVSRSAFYVHFEDKYDLLRSCMETLKREVFMQNEGLSIEQRMLAVLQRVRENIRTLKNLTSSELDKELMMMMQQSFTDDLTRMMEKNNIPREALPGPPEIIAVYISAGIASTIMYWVSNNMSIPEGEIVAMLVALQPKKMEGMR